MEKEFLIKGILDEDGFLRCPVCGGEKSVLAAKSFGAHDIDESGDRDMALQMYGYCGSKWEIVFTEYGWGTNLTVRIIKPCTHNFYIERNLSKLTFLKRSQICDT